MRQSLNLLLLVSVSCFWFGCNTAAKELVKESRIFLRERDFNLRVAAYFASKMVVLALIAATQATLLFVIIRPWCQPAGWAPQQSFDFRDRFDAEPAFPLQKSSLNRFSGTAQWTPICVRTRPTRP